MYGELVGGRRSELRNTVPCARDVILGLFHVVSPTRSPEQFRRGRFEPALLLGQTRCLAVALCIAFYSRRGIFTCLHERLSRGVEAQLEQVSSTPESSMRQGRTTGNFQRAQNTRSNLAGCCLTSALCLISKRCNNLCPPDGVESRCCNGRLSPEMEFGFIGAAD
jgi:hypothetical protein